MDISDYNTLARAVARIAYDAGQVILQYYEKHEHSPLPPNLKDDGSPVTQADLAANQIITEGLSQLTPTIPIVSEEGAYPEVPPGGLFWLVDPLDGTKQYLARTNEFTVNIGLVHQQAPLLGIIYIPTQNKIFVGYDRQAFCGQGHTADTPIQCRMVPTQGIAALQGRAEDEQAYQQFQINEPIASRYFVSSALKFCLIAEGGFDLYIRHGVTYEWDTAAGQAIVEAAGGQVFGPDGKRLRYQKPGFVNPAFMVVGKR